MKNNIPGDLATYTTYCSPIEMFLSFILCQPNLGKPLTLPSLGSSASVINLLLVLFVVLSSPAGELTLHLSLSLLSQQLIF